MQGSGRELSIEDGDTQICTQIGGRTIAMKLDMKWEEMESHGAVRWLEHREGQRHHSLCMGVKWAPPTGRLRYLPEQLKNLPGDVCCGDRIWSGNDSRVSPGLQVKGDLEWDRSMNGAWVWRVSPRD